MMQSVTRQARSDAGFTLVEVLIALAVISGSALALASVLAQGVQLLKSSQQQMIATEKAAEAVETVFSARDTSILTWAQIRNIVGETGNDNGVFKDGPQPLREPGPDGLINTADDGPVQQLVLPGADGVLGNDDDQKVPLTDYTREITIRTLGVNLRSITVTVTYRVNGGTRTHVLTTYISSYA